MKLTLLYVTVSVGRLGSVLSDVIIDRVIQRKEKEETFVQLVSEPGDYIGQGDNETFSDENDVFCTTTMDDGTATVNYISCDAGGYRYEFQGADETATFTAGSTYDNAVRYPFNKHENGMDVSGDGRGCNELDGRFDIREFVLDDTAGKLEHLALNFEQHCEHSDAVLYGWIRYRSSLPVEAPDTIIVDSMMILDLKNNRCLDANDSDDCYLEVVVEQE